MNLLKNMGLIGDRILVRVESRTEQKTQQGIILPSSVLNDDKISSGIVVMVGPGMIAGAHGDKREEWLEEPSPEAKFIPLQINVGYRVLFMPKYAYEVQVDGQLYMIMQQGAVIVYDKDPFNLIDN